MEAPVKDIRDYLYILKNRKRYFLVPALVLFIVITSIALLLPSIFESSATILIEEQQIPQDFVRSTVTGFADQRIQSLTQQILSRGRLQEIIKKFTLYPELQDKYTQEEIIEKMRKDIKFETISADIADTGSPVSSGGKKKSKATVDAVTIAFKIAYQGKNPDTVQKVAGTLSSLYLEQNLKDREEKAQTTTAFLQAELKGLQERIRMLGEQITAFKSSHEGMLPELMSFNLQQAETLERDIKQSDNNIRAAEDRKIYLEGQLATIKPDTPIISSTGERVGDAESRMHVLQVALAELRSRFGPNHPEVLKAKRELAELETLAVQQGSGSSLRRQKITQLESELAQKKGKYSEQHPEVRKLTQEIALLKQQQAAEKAVAPKGPINDPSNPAYITLSAQINAASTEIASMKKQRQELFDKLKVYKARLEKTPQVEQEYLALSRDYQNAQTKYQEVMNKMMEARISEGMEERQKGEKFTLIDPAGFPEKPVKPKRLLIILAGMIFSCGAGLGTVALAENLDHSVKTAEDLVQLTPVPVLGSISQIATAADLQAAQSRRHLAWMVTGCSLVMGLLIVHFFVLDLWILWAKLQRLANKYT